MGAWNGWYHVTGCTYGSWLPGDPRGWRERHHRKHVEGDYRNPPAAGVHEQKLARSRALMNRDAVRLSSEAAAVAARVMASSLRRHEREVLVVAVDDHHYHILVRCDDGRPRHWVGIAKKDSARELSRLGIAKEGGVWAVRCRCLGVRDREHQVNAYRYIGSHAERGASVWTYRDPGTSEGREVELE